MTNFHIKSINLQDSTETLENLTWINYIVGENGSGKNYLVQTLSNNTTVKALNPEETLRIFEQNEWPSYINNKYKALLIHNPENSLYPNLQKLIPKKLEEFSKQYNIQIIVTTNSPFIIARMSKITEIENRRFNINNDSNFLTSQKVYLLKNRQIADKYNQITLDFTNKPKGRYGYWAEKANLIASSMLSSGLNSENFSDNPYNAPYLILCEGASVYSDSVVYNQIIQNYNNTPVLFISCKSKDQVASNFQFFQQIKASLSAEFKLLCLRDRDHEFNNEADITKFEIERPHHKVLRRRAIEAYLYNSETAKVLLRKYKQKITASDTKKLDLVSSQIQNEAENGILGHDYKLELKNTFLEVLNKYGDEIRSLVSNPNISLPVDIIAPLINKRTKVYKELTGILFGSIVSKVIDK